MAGRGDEKPDTLHPALLGYLKRLPALARDYEPSVFWQRQLEGFQGTYQRSAELDDAEIASLVLAGSYGFEALPHGVTSADADPAFALARSKARETARLSKQVSPGGVGLDKRDWEHMRALDFLAREDLLDEYVAFLRPLPVRSSMSVARHWYYARQIGLLADAALGPGRRLDVLEIGAGAGNLAWFLTLLDRVRVYCIVDLPEMLLHSGYTVTTLVPDAAMAFDDPALASRADDAAPVFEFVPAQRAAELPDRAFDLCLNLNSFMEMDRGVRDGYIQLVYRAGRPGALFYNVNRRQPALPLPDGGTWDNNPLLYPYRPDDDVLVWEEDPFQTVTRTKYGRRATLTVTRAAAIAGADGPQAARARS